MYICLVKDYYYILGVEKKATQPEIRQAYQKLALKFHPDNNDHDPFFTLHYEKVKEAYQVLSDDHKRFRYDKALGDNIAAEVDHLLPIPAPVISSFFASKKASQKGDLLTISWEVLNADHVHIDKIGEVATNGTQTIRLTEGASSEEFLKVKLEASNLNSDQVSTKVLSIKNLAYVPALQTLKRKQEHLTQQETTTGSTNKKKKTTKIKKTRKPKATTTARVDSNSHRKREQGAAYVLVAVMFFIILLMLYTMHSINPMF